MTITVVVTRMAEVTSTCTTRCELHGRFHHAIGRRNTRRTNRDPMPATSPAVSESATSSPVSLDGASTISDPGSCSGSNSRSNQVPKSSPVPPPEVAPDVTPDIASGIASGVASDVESAAASGVASAPWRSSLNGRPRDDVGPRSRSRRPSWQRPTHWRRHRACRMPVALKPAWIMIAMPSRPVRSAAKPNTKPMTNSPGISIGRKCTSANSAATPTTASQSL